MRDSNAERIDKGAIAPEIAATEPSSAESQALLANESDESQTMSYSSDASDGVALSRGATTPEAKEV
ncbi:MAG: hypothetical protein HLUCCA11_15010 [Phormidesmis priestleyi Ana]|uniref:Uncharacterized protein n=1 Tax=Phormidesmis priestleyi Ana TaxID=1666911 RepID=A0A0N8KMQ7_9CYAN|nr:MAG: hypothetical protein HLUCCA11_15010 [Phormidesmis priestleyi Ana]